MLRIAVLQLMDSGCEKQTRGSSNNDNVMQGQTKAPINQAPRLIDLCTCTCTCPCRGGRYESGLEHFDGDIFQLFPSSRHSEVLNCPLEVCPRGRRSRRRHFLSYPACAGNLASGCVADRRKLGQVNPPQKQRKQKKGSFMLSC